MTSTDTNFAGRFPDMSATTFVANQKALTDWTPTASTLNTGMMSDIARAYIYAPDVQENFYARFMASPLPRGDSVMSASVSEVTSRVYNPKAPDTDLFNGQYATMISNVATKNLSRQIATEVNDYVLKQFTQTEEMIGDAMAAIMAPGNVAHKPQMCVESKGDLSRSTRYAKANQMHTLRNTPHTPKHQFAS